MYQTLYRKYRPQNFDEVIGQQVIVRTLKNAILNKRLNHAYLFTGPRGTGKTSIAKIFAKTINCSNLEGTNPCNCCDSCIQILNKQSIDIIEIDAASNNGVDEIRELRSKANLVPTIGKYKVYIIDEVHMLTTGAFNALLKTLEEPPTHIVFILATTEPHKIPATIISRCQRFDFKKIPYENMIIGLKNIVQKENIVVEEDVYKEIARQSDGCMRDALSILDQVIAFSDEKVTIENVHEISGTLPEEQLISFLISIKSKKYEQVFTLIEEYDNLGKNYIKLSEELIYVLRNILLLLHIPNYELDENKKMQYNTLLSLFSLNEIMDIIKTMNVYLFEMRKTSNTRIVFEVMTIALMQAQVEGLKDSEDNFAQETTDFPKNSDKKKQEQGVRKETEKVKCLEMDSLSTEKELKHFNEIKRLQDIRINNTLFAFNKQKMKIVKTEMENIRNLLIVPNYSTFASILMDTEVKAVSDDHILLLCKNERMEMEFLKNLQQIDQTLEKVFGQRMYSVPINPKDWDRVKNEFNSKIKKYTFIEEPQDISIYFEDDQNKLSTIDCFFEDIVEYN